METNNLLLTDINRCIRVLSEKFRKWPYNFFTESDAHAYLYYSFFRYGSPALKKLYHSNDQKKTVLIHREYPTSYRYSQKELIRYSLEKRKGTTVGHYDMVVLNPAFIENHKIQQVISKDNTIRQTVQFGDKHVLAAIEFKLLHKPLSKGLKEEIHKDFVKLGWALETGQAKEAYMLIFNRYGKEESYWGVLDEYQKKQPDIKLIYQESYYDNRKHITFIKSSLRLNR
ncbi:MAG: hypothetical protein PHS46_06840 [Candidatus Omnitrophica bacterium]|nr:hypothetical protein [Candidatus Omnitrophota bacterium]